ncbi:hypothetical protein CAEBREN_21051 [Caenorhabditis brenneri]|uniref:Uncharacterized protein n=1 Tax=Caenorhabditis brenneri TaxID=135651 RepID=G0NKW3_CAEBE|nr:hypothetical protein CAEBREN_21051 [Caenorhabditis brenneri]
MPLIDQTKPIESIHRHRMNKGEYVFIVRRTGATFFTANSYQEISHAERALDEYCEKNGFTELQEFIAAKRQEVIDKKEARKKEAAERRDRKRAAAEAAVEAMNQTCRRSKRVAALSQARTAFKPTPVSAAPSSSAPSSSSTGSIKSNNSLILPASANSRVLKNAPTSSTPLNSGPTGSSTGNPSAALTMGQLFGESSKQQGYIPTIYLLAVDPKAPQSKDLVLTEEKENQMSKKHRKK